MYLRSAAAVILASTALAQTHLEAHRQNNAVVVRLATAPDRFYVVDESQNLPVWSESQIFNGSGAPMQLTNTISGESRYFRVRTFPTVQVSKPGTSMLTQLTLSNSAAQWVVSGEMPTGISFRDGAFSGDPTADAAEKYPDGNYTNTVRLTIPGTGEQLDRQSSAEVVHKVKLSFARNIYADRPNGPAFGSVCLKCHGSGFPPNFMPSAVTLINAPAGSGGVCPSTRDYIQPGQPQNSLIFTKVTAPTCGDRMPQGGPFYSQTQIDRLARWITELAPGEID